VGCGDASDKIECLRQAPYDKIYAHQGTVGFFVGSYRGLSLPWLPRPSQNDKYLPESPDLLTASGKIANVPLMMGDMRDEGTLFSLIAGLNTTTDEEVKNYFNKIWWPKATEAQLNRLLELYPRSAGAPFEGALLDSLPGPQYGRIAAIQGDYVFEACRRQLFSHFPGPIWNYQTEITLPLSVLDNSIVGELLGTTGLTNVPVLGSFHAFDALFYLFETIPAALSHNVQNIMSTVVSFVNHQDPNYHNLNIPKWPQYDLNARKSYQFKETGPKIITDNYRQAGTDFFNNNAGTLRV
jgi:acetylcholinesterase